MRISLKLPLCLALLLIINAVTPAQKPALVLQEGHKDIISAGAFSQDGKLLASSSAKTVKLWDVATGTELRTMRFDGYSVYALAFSTDGKMLAGGRIMVLLSCGMFRPEKSCARSRVMLMPCISLISAPTVNSLPAAASRKSRR